MRFNEFTYVKINTLSLTSSKKFIKIRPSDQDELFDGSNA